MKIPPIEWHDLIAIGVSPTATITSDATSCTVDPQPSRLVVKLIAAAWQSPPPDVGGMPYLRHVRDLLIGCTDWTQAADSPLTEEQRAAWATYRQALRDLPQAYSGAGPIPWPTAP